VEGGLWKHGQGSFVKRFLLLLTFLVFLLGTYIPLTQVRDARPPEVRLGFFPPAPVVKALSADQYQFSSQVITLQCLFYFGSIVEEHSQVLDWSRVHEALYTATRLDPYNMDAYYFAQAVLTWDAGKPQQAIDLLEYGFAHRTWDWYLPFFLSFDYAFFLKDYIKAAEYMAKAAELNPHAWFSTLAARYFYEGGETAFALAYLKEMINTARSESLKKHMIIRAEALEKILELEEAILLYRTRYKEAPKKLDDLIRVGIVRKIPEDPYGGSFYLDELGKVRTTSKLAFKGKSRDNHNN
jgi:tetratricopeptide (TPR) repeat protein